MSTSGGDHWALWNPLGSLLVYLGPSRELDLSGSTGTYRVNRVDPRSGKVSPGERVDAGKKIRLPDATVVWLRKE